LISREDLIVQSIQSFVTSELRGLGYTPQRVELLDGFDAGLFEERYGETGLDRTYVAIAFQFDDGGTQAELGSSLKAYLHTIDRGSSLFGALGCGSGMRSWPRPDGLHRPHHRPVQAASP
jgi:hypothetical protein